MPEIAPEFARDDEDTERRKDLAVLRMHAQQLSERFDAVEIIAVRDNGSRRGCVHASNGAGNWYARYGAVRAWLSREEGGMANGDE